MIKHVHIISSSSHFLPRFYVLSLLAECWQKWGIEVTIGPIDSLEADIGIIHVDATWVPSSCLPANPLGRPLLNGQVLDISKRRISRNILSWDSDYKGPVIIKTDANYYGEIEFNQLPSWSLKRWRRKLTKKLPWQVARELPHKTYPVLDSLAEVPQWVWRRNDLVVERFLPEIENGEFVVRCWLFLGNHEYGVKIYSREPVVKASNTSRREYLDTVPESLRVIRSQLGMDFGKFDYVMVNNEAILLDVNRTPSTSTERAPSEKLLQVASGIMDFPHNAK